MSCEAAQIQRTNLAASSLGLLAYFSLVFLMESGSEMFRQDIIYVSEFQRHPTCKRERKEEKPI